MNATNLRHYAKFQNDEVVLVGYNQGRNEVLLCRVLALPHDEQIALRQIASSIVAQEKHDFLVPLLQIERHPSGADWFTYLANRLQRRDGTVLSVPMKDVADINTDQKAFFSGYGTTVTEADAPVASPAPQARATGAVVAPAADPTMAAILAQMVETNQKILEKLDALTPAGKAAPKRRVTKRKVVAKKKVAKKRVSKKAIKGDDVVDIPQIDIPAAPVATAVAE